jgi:glycosyltransferase involved in cell wall biosynthesis
MPKSNEDMRLRILHVLSSFDIGGQERVALELAGAQVRRGHEVAAVSLAPLPHGPLAEDLRARGIAVHGLPKLPSFDTRLIVRLVKLLRERDIDVVHTHNPQPLAYGAAAGRLAGRAVVHTKHGVNPERGRRLWLRRLGGHLAHAYVAVSDATADVARKNRECRPERLRVIPNGVDLEAYRPDAGARRAVRAELGIPEDSWVFGTVGRVSVEKDHALLVRAAGPLLGPRVRLVIAGDGSEMKSVRDEARRYEPWVVLTGMRSDVPRVLASFDAFVLSSRSEGLPLALLEGMATALPVVATDVGGVSEVVQRGRAGVLVPPRNEDALRRALAALVADRAAARTLADRALSRARHYDSARIVDLYMEVYECVSGNP